MNELMPSPLIQSSPQEQPQESTCARWTARAIAGHRFLVAHAFYPLMFCTMLCFAFVGTRAYITRTPAYLFLVKNLFLAWVPYFFSLAASRMHRVGPYRWWAAAGIWSAWLAMFPNAPYVFTDLIHWRNRGVTEMPWWFDLGLVLMFGLAGCFAGIVSLRIMHDLVRRMVGGHAGDVAGWFFAGGVAMLSGFGVYLGRFDRWNSWDLLTRPHHVAWRAVWDLTAPYAQSRTMGVTLMFGAMMLATYVMFVTTAAVERATATGCPSCPGDRADAEAR